MKYQGKWAVCYNSHKQRFEATLWRIAKRYDFLTVVKRDTSSLRAFDKAAELNQVLR